jgi:diacylglycerol kinase
MTEPSMRTKVAHKRRQSLGSTRVLLALLLCLTTWTMALWSRFG